MDAKRIQELAKFAAENTGFVRARVAELGELSQLVDEAVAGVELDDEAAAYVEALGRAAGCDEKVVYIDVEHLAAVCALATSKGKPKGSGQQSAVSGQKEGG